MKLLELKERIDALCRNEYNLGKNVYLMIVEDGITYAQTLEGLEVGDPADGSVIWIHTGETLNPEWIE